MTKIIKSTAYISAAIVLMATSISAQQYGERIGRLNRQNVGFGSLSFPNPNISQTSVSMASSATQFNSGYPYLPPTSSILLPSSSSQQDYQVNFGLAVQAFEAVQQQIEEDSAQKIQPEQSFPEILADQNSLVSDHQQQTIDEEIAFWDFRESIPGEPELDYPILDKVPKTSFTCTGRQDGYYADVETHCQVFHVCTNIPNADPIKASFLCSNGTVFSQSVLVCQWWPDVKCASSPQFFELNRNIGVVPESSPPRERLTSQKISYHV